jgi:hypothetical protein
MQGGYAVAVADAFPQAPTDISIAMPADAKALSGETMPVAVRLDL